MREAGTAAYVLRAAPRAPHSGLNGSHLSRPSFLLAEHDKARGVENGHSFTGPTVHPQIVSVTAKITDVIQTLAAHGFRLTAYISAEQAVSSAAKAATIGASRTIIAISESRSRLFHICSEQEN